MLKKILDNKKYFMTAWLVLGVLIFAWSFFSPVSSQNESTDVLVVEDSVEKQVDLFVFVREGCHFCASEKEFLSEVLPEYPDVQLTLLDVIKDDDAREHFLAITAANELPQATPITLVGGEVIFGYASDQTTGQEIIAAFDKARAGKNYTLEGYVDLDHATTTVTTAMATTSEDVCEGHASDTPCVVDASDEGTLVDLPFLGVVDVETFSLFTLSSVLGLIDGFNPCALWVLMTFLLILMQIGDRKKLLKVAGMFIVAEAVMYYLILTAWYSAWDFVRLDAIVTPLIGLLAFGSGGYFLQKWYKSREQLTCDVTDLEQQADIQKRITKLVHAPMTVATILGIVGIALSVNIIEFACSIGIPQVFTKVLEMNMLSFWSHQWYMFLYILGYMVDDFVVFGFAFYGIDKMHASEKYSRLSMLIGGVLMVVLGIMFWFFPDALVF